MTTVVLFRDDLRVTDHPAGRARRVRRRAWRLDVLDEESRASPARRREVVAAPLPELTGRGPRPGAPSRRRRGPAGRRCPASCETGADRLPADRRYGGPERTVDAGLGVGRAERCGRPTVRRFAHVRAVDRQHPRTGT
ncbi:hypothetical protein QJS66_13680 [Kocuria rhizophila]|nr:hypothetical protein QJS66_13680 [Kocuria rhizophila]